MPDHETSSVEPNEPTLPLSILGKLVKISRPRFWLYTAGPFLIGYIAGLPNGYRGIWPLPFWLLLAYFLFPANVFLYGINDLFDSDTDDLNAKKDAQEYRVRVPDHQWLILALVVSSLLSLMVFFWLPESARLLFLLFVTLSTAYSVPPFRFKAHAFLDSYSNLLYVVPGFIGYYLTAGQYPPAFIVIAAVCWAAGMHAYSAIPDIEPDQQAGIHTIAVVLGKNKALLFVTANWAVFAGLSIYILGWFGLFMLIYPGISLLLFRRPSWSVSKAYWWFPVLNGLIGFFVFVYKTVLS